jgi:hypothetical protein
VPALLLSLLSQAALARTTDLDPSIPTIAFLITDAPPHLASDYPTSTSRNELQYLTSQRNLSQEDAGDTIKCFRATALQHFAGNLILNCVVYDMSRSSELSAMMQLYGCLAQQTGGMLMKPDSRSPAVLANGLTTVVKLLLSRMNAAGLPQASQQQDGSAAAAAAAAAAAGDNGSGSGLELEGFRLLDLSGLREDVASEADELGSVAYGNTAALFAIAMERMVAGEAAEFKCCY